MKATAKTFIIFFVFFYLIWVIRATVFYSAVDQSIPGETARLVFSNTVKFLLWVVPAAFYIAWVERQNPLVAMKVITPIDRRGLALGAVVSLLFFVATFVFEKFSSGRSLIPLLQTPAGVWLVTLVQVAFSPVSEELMFRGFVLPQLSKRMEFWQVNLLQAFLFTAMHWPNWIWVSGFRPALLATSMGVFAIGLLLGWLLKRTNSIWPPVAIHITNNFLAGFLG